ncbi:MAG: tripartite tricarboxylate transporter substrate-binding protein [Comamonas sp.]
MTPSSSRSVQPWPTRRRLLAAGAALPLAGLAVSAPARAEAPFPSQPLRVIVPFGAGGVADLTARVVAQHMAGTLGQPVVIDNRPGAGGVVAADAVAKARPDGHTLLLMSNANAIGVSLFKSLPFDTLRDFQPVSTLGTFDLALFVPAGSRFKTFADFAAAARAQPGALNVGTISVGSTQNLAAELLKTAAGVDVQVVPFNGSPAVFSALRGEQVDAAVEILTPMMPHVQAGTARALLVTNARRARALPDVPSAPEAGVPRLQAASWNALAVPARTPAPVVERLHQAIAAAIAAPEVRSRLEALYIDPRASTPQEAAALLREDVRRWGEVIRQAGVPQQG